MSTVSVDSICAFAPCAVREADGLYDVIFVCARMRGNRCPGNPVILTCAPTHKFVFHSIK